MPCGNIYVADFYNKIIGHYEVPLDHPDRDRTSGRVWQIRYVGDSPKAGEVAEYTREMKQAPAVRTPLVQQIESGSVREQIAAMNAAGELGAWPDDLHSLVIARLDHENAHVARAAAEAIGLVETSNADTQTLIAKLSSVDSADVVLRQTIRIAIRNCLLRRDRQDSIWKELISADVPPQQRDEVALILLAVDGERVVAPLVRYLSDGRGGDKRRDLIRHAAIHADEANLDSIVKLARELTRDSIEEQEQLLDSLLAAQTRFQSGGSAGGSLRQWALDLANDSLNRFRGASGDGVPLVGWSTSDGKPWQPEQRKLQRGGTGLLHSSFSRGETYTGVLRSDPFPSPKTISFYLAGHVGRPDKADHGKNFVRLVRVADDTVIHEARPPRNDTAQWITWKCDGEPAELVRIEAHDGDDGTAYAWLAIGQFDPPWLDQTASLVHLQTAITWASRLKLQELIEPFEAILRQEEVSAPLQIETALAIAAIEQKADWQAILMACKDRAHMSILSKEVLALFAMRDAASQSDDPARAAIRKVVSHLSVKDENAFAQQWVRTGGTSHRLLDACEAGWLNPAVLAEANVSEVLRARVNDDESKRLQKLIAGITPRSVEDDRKHQELVQAIATIRADATQGAELFKRNCAACHQLRGTGAVVGPQLDGVLSRTDERLIEDILMPDRNVDAAFRTTSFLMDDGRVIVGMVQAEADTEIKLADQTGKILQINTDEIETRIESNRSLMPGNFADTLSAADLANLFMYMRNP
jgi:putative heme-binding domain-containing protein